MNKKYIITFLFSVIFVTGASLFFTNQDNVVEKILKEYGVAFSKVTNVESIKNAGGNIIVFLDGSVIKLKIFQDLKEDSIEKYIEEQTVLFESLFKPQLPPYPEFLTRETGCGKRFLPVKNIGVNGDYYKVFAGKRFGFGICADDLIEYKASLKFLYCPNTGIVAKFEYFIPDKIEFHDLNEVTESFRCL